MDLSKNIDRFLDPQETACPVALAEIRAGRKAGHRIKRIRWR